MKLTHLLRLQVAALTAATAFGMSPSALVAGETEMTTYGGKNPPENLNLWDAGRPDSHAPIGVMGDHTHEAGEWMLSYRYMHMSMEQNYLGDSVIGDAQIIAPTAAGGQGFMVTPNRMTMEMQMAGLMFAPTDELTLMLMIPWVHKSMDHVTRAGGTFTTRSHDWGDLKVGGLWKVYDNNRQRVHLNLNVSLPTGATNETDFIPGPGVTRLPYPMQIGSGTFDILPGVTYLGQCDHWSWGAQAIGNIRTGRNNEGYTLGNVFTGHVWGSRKFTDWLSSSLRLSVTSWGNITGRDNFLVVPAGAVPTADPTRRGGTRVDLAGGVNYYLRKGPLKGMRLAVEAGLPVYQRLAGPQLGTDWFITLGAQKAF